MSYLLSPFVAAPVILSLFLGCTDVPAFKPAELSMFEVGLPNGDKRWIKAEDAIQSSTRCTFFARQRIVATFDPCVYIVETPYAHNLKLP